MPQDSFDTFHLVDGVDAEALFGAGLVRLATQPVIHQDLDDVGEVILTLSIVGADPSQRPGEPAPGEHIYRSPHLGTGELIRSCILCLDDTDHAICRAQNAAVRPRFIQHNGQQGCGRLGFAMEVEKSGQGFATNQGHVTGHDDHVVLWRHMEALEADHGGVTGPELFERLKELDLPEGHYAVFGSGPLLVRGIIEDAGDIDVIARGKAWTRALEQGDLTYLPEEGVTVVGFFDGALSVGTSWAFGDVAIRHLIDTAEEFDGVPFVLIAHGVAAKQGAGRDKDRVHLERTADGMQSRSV